MAETNGRELCRLPSPHKNGHGVRYFKFTSPDPHKRTSPALDITELLHLVKLINSKNHHADLPQDQAVIDRPALKQEGSQD